MCPEANDVWGDAAVAWHVGRRRIIGAVVGGVCCGVGEMDRVHIAYTKCSATVHTDTTNSHTHAPNEPVLHVCHAKLRARSGTVKPSITEKVLSETVGSL